MSNRATALVLGTNAGQADLTRYLTSKGWRVVACGYQPKGPGVELADKFALVDTVDLDAVVDLARRESASLVYSVASDLAIATAVRASERLGLPRFLGSELIDVLIRKPGLRERLERANISPVSFRVVGSWEETRGWSSFPCVVKPSFSQGQRGVTLVHSEPELPGAIDRALGYSRTGTAILEEYLPGVEVSFNVLVCRGQIVVEEVTERLVHPFPLIGIPRGHVLPPLSATAEELAAAASLVRQIVRELSVSDGVLYYQMKLTPDGPRVVEIAPRLDGCHIWRLLEIARRFDLIDLMMKCLCGETVVAPQRPDIGSGAYELRFHQMAPGLRFGAERFPVPSDALYNEYRYEDGEAVEPINGQLEVVGYYVRRCR